MIFLSSSMAMISLSSNGGKASSEDMDRRLFFDLSDLKV
jgi:hypothetical protein